MNASRSHRLVATDLDGTLLDSQQAIHPNTTATFQALERNGVYLVVATGRHHVPARRIVESLGVVAHLISSNGARVHDAGGMLMYSCNIDAPLVVELVSIGASLGLLTCMYTDDRWLSSAAPPPEVAARRFPPIHVELKAYATGVAKVFYSGSSVAMKELERQLHLDPFRVLNVTSSHISSIEVTAAGATKGTALRRVMEKLLVHGSECIAFGDALNDLDMLQSVGTPFVMKNSQPDLLSQLRSVPVVGSNDEQGVARQLVESFQLPSLL